MRENIKDPSKGGDKGTRPPFAEKEDWERDSALTSVRSSSSAAAAADTVANPLC